MGLGLDTEVKVYVVSLQTLTYIIFEIQASRSG